MLLSTLDISFFRSNISFNFWLTRVSSCLCCCPVQQCRVKRRKSSGSKGQSWWNAPMHLSRLIAKGTSAGQQHNTCQSVRGLILAGNSVRGMSFVISRTYTETASCEDTASHSCTQPCRRNLYQWAPCWGYLANFHWWKTCTVSMCRAELRPPAVS